MRKYCAFCGAWIPQRPIDGTDPRDADGSWFELYECEDGHEGRIEWSAGDGIERFGAIADKVVIDA